MKTRVKKIYSHSLQILEEVGIILKQREVLDILKENNIKISMDGRGRFQDNIFIERLWWTLKYHYFYLRTFETGSELRNGLRNWFRYYNQERFHQSLENWTPNEIYYKKQELKKAA